MKKKYLVIKKNYKLISYKLFIALVVIMLSSGIIFGFDKGDLFLFILGSIFCYLIYKKEK